MWHDEQEHELIELVGGVMLSDFISLKAPHGHGPLFLSHISKIVCSVFGQACTEMILPTGGNTKDSIFPASKWSYGDRLSFCKRLFGVEPRRTWITTHFGGHVRIIYTYISHQHHTTTIECQISHAFFFVSILLFGIGESISGSESVNNPYSLLSLWVGSLGKICLVLFLS